LSIATTSTSPPSSELVAVVVADAVVVEVADAVDVPVDVAVVVVPGVLVLESEHALLNRASANTATPATPGISLGNLGISCSSSFGPSPVFVCGLS
jgi:hypothetical protein